MQTKPVLLLVLGGVLSITAALAAEPNPVDNSRLVRRVMQVRDLENTDLGRRGLGEDLKHGAEEVGEGIAKAAPVVAQVLDLGKQGHELHKLLKGGRRVRRSMDGLD